MHPTPVEITRANQWDVRIRWSDRHESVYPARYLRLRCPCAICVEETTGRALLDPAGVTPDIHPLAIRAVGTYAIEFEWSDGHETGIYSYEYLRRICPCEACAVSREP